MRLSNSSPKRASGKMPMAKRPGDDDDGEAKAQKRGHSAAEPGPVPSGRVLRNVAGWKGSGIPVSTESDLAALLLDMAAEEIASIAGDPMKTAKASAAADAGWVVPTCVVLWLQVSLPQKTLARIIINDPRCDGAPTVACAWTPWKFDTHHSPLAPCVV